MRQPTRQRLLQAAISYLLGIATRIAVQIAALPILFVHWTTERVGLWMMLFAVPAYLVVAGDAFASAGGNLALTAAREERWADARSAFRASWIWASLFSVLIALVMVGAAVLVPEARARGWGLAGRGELIGCATALGLYIVAVAQASAMRVPVRIGERYPEHNNFLSLASLAEVAVLAVCVPASPSFVVLASGLAAMRGAFALAHAVAAYRSCPVVFRGPGSGLGAPLRALAAPSAAFMLMPMIYVFNLQAYTVLVGIAYGASVVAGFVTTRVLVRSIDLVMSIVYASQFNEAGYLDRERKDLQRRQLATMTVLTLIGTAAFSLAIMLAGPWLQATFSDGKSAFDPAIAAVLLVSGAIRGLAANPLAILTAANRHARLVIGYALGSLAAFALAAAAVAAGLALPVALLALVVAELCQTVPLFRQTLAYLDWDRRGLGQALFARQRLGDCIAVARLLFRRH